MKIDKNIKIILTKEEAEILHKAESLLDDIIDNLFDGTNMQVPTYDEIFEILNRGLLEEDYKIIAEGY